MILVYDGHFIWMLLTAIVLYIVVKIGVKRCDEQEKQYIKQSNMEYNKTMQEIRRKAGCKDIHAWDIKNI